MITRVTENIKFSMITNNLFNVASEYGVLMEKLSTQKNINRPSDDPIGTNDILDFRTAISSIDQYKTNITDANIWLNLTGTNIAGLRKIVDQAKFIAIEESGAGASPETRQTSLATLNSLINEALTLLNTQNGDNYLFGGSVTDVEPFTANYASASVGTVQSVSDNAFNGTVTSGGTYTATQNNNYALRIVTGGTLATATYQISSDGGENWGTTQSFPAQTVTGSIANTSGSVPITGATVWNTIDGAGVVNGDTISIAGFQHNGTPVSSTFTIANAATGTVQDLLNSIETAFGSTASASIDSTGRIILTDNTTGASSMSLTLTANNQGGGALDFGAISATAAVSIGDGITMNFAAGSVNLQANDTFIVNGTAAGFYQGNDDKLYAVVGKNNNMAFNITGAEAFTGRFATADIAGAGVTGDHTISLTRGATPASWSITSPAGAVITAQSAETLTIDTSGVPGLGANIITVDITGTWSQNDTISLSLSDGTTTGDQIPAIFTGSGNIDLMATLNALKTALSETDQDSAERLIGAQVNNLKTSETQLLQYETQAGAKMKSLQVTGGNHDSINLQITNMLADIENADLTKLITQFQMKQIAMQASYNMAAQIGKMTIMDYI